MYILFEGIDRVGKTTQIELLSKKLENVLLTKEPGGSELGREIRRLLLHSNFNPSPKAQLFLFLADRAQHIQEVIKPNLSKKLIVSDRGFISGIAYAFANGGLSLKELCYLNALAQDGVYPDKIIFLEISKVELKKRIESFSLDNIEKEGVEYLLKVQKVIKRVLPLLKIPYLHLDATLSKEELHSRILNFIRD